MKKIIIDFSTISDMCCASFSNEMKYAFNYNVVPMDRPSKAIAYRITAILADKTITSWKKPQWDVGNTINIRSFLVKCSMEHVKRQLKDGRLSEYEEITNNNELCKLCNPITFDPQTCNNLTEEVEIDDDAYSLVFK